MSKACVAAVQYLGLKHHSSNLSHSRSPPPIKSDIISEVWSYVELVKMTQKIHPPFVWTAVEFTGGARKFYSASNKGAQ